MYIHVVTKYNLAYFLQNNGSVLFTCIIGLEKGWVEYVNEMTWELLMTCMWFTYMVCSLVWSGTHKCYEVWSYAYMVWSLFVYIYGMAFGRINYGTYCCYDHICDHNIWYEVCPVSIYGIMSAHIPSCTRVWYEVYSYMHIYGITSFYVNIWYGICSYPIHYSIQPTYAV